MVATLWTGTVIWMFTRRVGVVVRVVTCGSWTGVLGVVRLETVWYTKWEIEDRGRYPTLEGLPSLKTE